MPGRNDPRPIPYPKAHPCGQAYLRWDGKYKYFGKYGTEEADQKYWQWRHELEHGKQVDNSWHVGELFEAYEKEYPKLQKDKFKAVNALGAISGLKCTEYGPLTYRKHRDIVASTGTRCARHVNDLMRLVQRIFRWGVSMGKVPLEVYSRLKTVDPLKADQVKRQSKPRKPAKRADVMKTLPELADMPAAIVQLILFTGARPGEICAMKASEVSKDGPHDTWVYRPEKHKTGYHGKRKFIAFGAKGQELLSKWWPSVGDYFFPASQAFGNYRTSSLMQAVEHACKRAGVPHWTPYQLRHLRLTEVAVDFGLETAAKLAGHGETGTTQGYAHQPDKTKLDEAA